ncbi:MAG: AAA domain-containing protein [Candidatus Methanoperedens sp.]|nr:AAA domain-containing protein [Candidatus Methanoperedens sp.]
MFKKQGTADDGRLVKFMPIDKNEDIKRRNEDNLLIGLNTNKYPDFNTLVWKLINHGFNKDILNKIQKGVYKINIPRNQLLDIIKIQTDQISTEQIEKIINEATEKIEKASILYQKQHEKALSSSLEEVSTIFKDNLVLPFNPMVEEEWDNMCSSDKLISLSPIPLNSEPLQILSAIKKENCKYITVEGPPGTGKSHTITAIVFDAILKNQSVLVLSDKKEALDVVEDKITETMNKVMHDKNFQNPILRLDKTGNTYNQILSTKSLDNIKIHYRAIKKDYQALEQNIEKSKNSLKEDLDAEILLYNEINIEEIFELIKLETYYEKFEHVVDIEEVLKVSESSIELEDIRKILRNFKDNLLNFRRNIDHYHEIFRAFNFPVDDFDVLTGFQEILPLKNAFPCILAGIRDYAEYIPLEPEIFDLVIIDEASQVSIAQAFPALLRAKKIVILGDKKQFSNVKSAQARSDTNREYLNNVKDAFQKHVSADITKLVKLDKFNIKTSILEFFESIHNYNIMLMKYFRGYKEIISYSNKNFYQDSLQVMKIRGKAVEDVIQFSVL